MIQQQQKKPPWQLENTWKKGNVPCYIPFIAPAIWTRGPAFSFYTGPHCEASPIKDNCSTSHFTSDKTEAGRHCAQDHLETDQILQLRSDSGPVLFLLFLRLEKKKKSPNNQISLKLGIPMCCTLSLQLCLTLWPLRPHGLLCATRGSHQAPLSMGFSRQTDSPTLSLKSVSVSRQWQKDNDGKTVYLLKCLIFIKNIKIF